MSWLFGINKETTPDFSQYASPLPVEEGSSKGDQGHVHKGAYNFDSTALERAAKAAKELEKSPYAHEVFELTKKQEEAKTMENMRIMKEREVDAERIKIEQIKIAGEEKRKAVQEETQQRQRQADYQDKLARKRYDEQLAQQTRVNEENLRKQEESVAKQEATRLKALEKEFKMREEMEVKKIESQVRAQALSDRENREINLEKIRTEAAENRKALLIEAEERRKTILESIQTTSGVVGLGMDTFLGDKSKVTTVIVGLSALAAGIYAAKYGLGVTARFVENRLTKPSLIRETSRFNFTDTFRHPIKTFKRYTSKAEDAMKGIVFEPSLEARLRDIAIATSFTKANKGLYRNILFYGPPGTGKTMFAKSLANHSGMDYAIMTGGDVAPLGSTGVTAMHKVFDWAKTSRRGVLLFIDEADAFLRKRNMERISEDMRATLNAFLYHTGEQSNKFMLVLASNLPEQFDTAIKNRIDEMVKFDLPNLEERERLVRLYFDKFILQPAASGAKRLKVSNFDYGAKCSEVAKITEGLSGREISKLGVAWQALVFASKEGILTEEMIDRTVKLAIADHAEKVLWDSVGRPEIVYVEKAMKDSASSN